MAYILKCSKCGSEVERYCKNPHIVCHKCKMERQRVYALNYAKNKKYAISNAGSN